MKLTVRDVIRAYPALEALAATQLPQPAAWQLGTAIDCLEPHVRRYNKHANELIAKYGKPNKDGVPEVAVDSPNRAEWEKEQEALLNGELEYPGNPISLKLFVRARRDERHAVVKDDKGNDVMDVIELNGAYLARCMKFFTE